MYLTCATNDLEVMSGDQNAGWSRNIKCVCSSVERVQEFRYLGQTWTNQTSICNEIKSTLKSGNACYYSVQNLLSSNLLSKNIKIKIYRTIILPVLCACETLPFTLRVEHMLRCLRIGCWGEYLGLRGNLVRGEWRKLHHEELNDLYSPNIVWVIKSRRMRWAAHVARVGREALYNWVLVGKPARKRPLGNPRRRWEDNIKMDLKWDVGHGLDRSSSRLGCGGHLWMR